MTHLALSGPSRLAGDWSAGEGARISSAAHPPVFLHCGWRTRGTWIWSRFRGMAGVTGYYEPLSERLAELRLDTLATINAESWPSGHRGLNRPYFEEFRPLLNPGQRGTALYRAHFASENFFAAADDAQSDLLSYLRQLLRVARERGDQPVLKFCRSLGRIGWMRRWFPDAVHVLVLRDPFSQFASAWRQYTSNGNAWFLTMPLRLLAINRDLPTVERSLDHMVIDLPCSAASPEGLARLEEWLRERGPAVWYRGFLAYWIATLATMPDDLDLVIDSDALALSRAYRAGQAVNLARITGLMPEFGDADAHGGDIPEPPLPRRSEALRAHAGAEAFFADQAGPLWADRRVLGFAAAKLAEARSRALGAVPPRLPNNPVRSLDAVAAGKLLAAEARAAMAEQALAAIRASRSWRATAPLRWLSDAAR